jgi:hypothetical protein
MGTHAGAALTAKNDTARMTNVAALRHMPERRSNRSTGLLPLFVGQ